MENTNPKYESLIQKHKVCVIIPTYNNAKTLGSVIERVLHYISDVIVVNDGSTDETKKVLDQFSQIQVINIDSNRGKGNALRVGFRNAIKQGYHHAITIDSDGQHFPKDLPKFFDKIDESPDSLIMGARDMSKEEVPGKSSFGNRFSNFWYYVETGIKLPDTQTGFRSYPLKEIEKLRLFTNKFELEIEVIVKLAWRGVPVLSIPVEVIYDYDDRVSHFRPFKDFTRISFLNTYLFILTLIYYLPVRLLRKVRKEGVWNILKKEWAENSDNDFKRALSLGVGVFMGIFPIWGFQMMVAALIAVALRLNKIIVLAASNISIPPMIPLILFCSYYTGSFFVENEADLSNWDQLSLESINSNFIQYFIGAIVFAFIAGGLSFLTVFGLLKFRGSGK